MNVSCTVFCMYFVCLYASMFYAKKALVYLRLSTHGLRSEWFGNGPR